MRNAPKHNPISELQNLLKQLSTQSLPVQTRAAIHDASRELDELADSLQANPEESRLAALYRVSNILGHSLDLDEIREL